MKTQKRIGIIIMIVVSLFVMTITAVCEQTAWDCPECGRTGNTGNFCGGCGHPAPTGDDVSSERKGNRDLSVGDVITFGTYPQTKEGTDQTPIEWIVLDVQDGEALLLSKYGLDAKPYNTEFTGITWDGCTLRNWLNREFLQAAFSAEEQAAILMTAVDNSDSQGYSEGNMGGGNNTRDQIFLLSYAEANRYLNVTYDDSNNISARVAPTAFAIANGALASNEFQTSDGEPAGLWCLRSLDDSLNDVEYVHYDGSLFYRSVSSGGGVARPALWINLESGLF